MAYQSTVHFVSLHSVIIPVNKLKLVQQVNTSAQIISQMLDSSSSSSSTSSLVVRKLDHRSDSLSYPLIRLPHNYKKSVSKLAVRIESIIEDNEEYHYRKCEEFYIGKSTVHKKKKKHFNPDKPSTWRLTWINQRWDARRERGYQAMAVLTVVTKDTLPHLESRRPAQWKQQYTIALEQGLITHFMFVEDDKRLANETTEPGNLEKSDAIAYVLYLAMKFGPYLVVSLDKLSYRLIKLPKHYNKSLSKLVEHIESIIETNEEHHGRECEGFYIGKSAIFEESGKDFDLDDRDTWDETLIKKHWTTRKNDGYQAMAVLAVVTEKTLPPASEETPEQYTLDLKKDLIKHFRDEKDKRLKNKSTAPGRPSSGGAAYVLYLAMEFEEESESDSGSDSGSDGGSDS